MESDQMQSQNKEGNEIYMKIWLAEQDFTKTRWTITTFFMSVSFAITAYSFQARPILPEVLGIRIFGMFIYWFAYIMYLHFFQNAKALRTYLINMEKSNQTNLDLQSWLLKRPKNKQARSTSRFLLALGLAYSFGIIVFFLLGY